VLVPPGYTGGFGYAVLRYADNGITPSNQLPTTSDWSDPPVNATSCPGFTSDAMVPAVRAQVPQTVQSTWFLVRFGIFFYWRGINSPPLADRIRTLGFQ
jgi:hypothetical protein